jgi:hypothetical protein
MREKSIVKACWVVFIFAATPLMAYSTPTLECGQYRLDGLLVKSREGNSVTLVTDRGTSVEFRFELSGGDPSTLNDRVGLNVSAVIQIKKPCAYRCQAKLLKIEEVISPLEQPRIFFFPKPKPIQPEVCSPSSPSATSPQI